VKRVYPPYGFKCPYTDNCPHLEGLSTTWVLEGYDRADRVYQEHLRIIDSFRASLDAAMKRIRLLEKENAELSAKNTALHRRQFKANKPAEVAAPAGKKRGAPVGHPGWFRAEPSHVDKTVQVPAPTICPHCGSDNLIPTEEVHEHIQEDIVIKPRTVVCRYVHKEAYCRRCGRPVAGAGEGELLHAPIGPVAKSVALYLRYRIGMTYRKVGEVFKDVFGLTFVPASALGFDRTAAKKGAPLYEDLREKMRASEVVHADETSWRNNGIGHYAWYAGNSDLAFFHIDRHRSTEVAQALLGLTFDGVLVTDRYAAYNGVHAKERQACLAHLITRAKEISRELRLMEGSSKDTLAETFCEHVARFFSQACAIGKELLRGNLTWKGTRRIEKRLTSELKKICTGTLQYKPAETLRAFLMGKDQKHLFTFLRHPGVPPTNNQAEQSIRFLVIFRKIMFGTRSEKGLRTHSILPSLVLTSLRQGHKPREFLEVLLTSDTKTAQDALYRNSS
jgi:transposase